MKKNIYDDEMFFEAYANMSRSKGGLKAAGEWSVLEALIPNLHGKSVLDLGCGYGWHCKYASDQNAETVLGIDLSIKMIEEALKRNKDSKIEYRVCSIVDYEYPQSKYDVVLSNLALHYIENLNDVYRKVYQTLKKNGIFVFNIEHPVFTAGINQDWIYDKHGNPLYWPVDNYYYPGERNTNFLDQHVVKQHHTFTQIINGLITIGFEIEAVQEVQPDEESLKNPEMNNEMRRPMMLLVRAKKK